MGVVELVQKPATETVSTSVHRLLFSIMEETHCERGISVVSGPYGIGKTTAINEFASEYGESCIVVKVPNGATRSGAGAVAVMQQIELALREMTKRPLDAQSSHTRYTLQQKIRSYLLEVFEPRWGHFRDDLIEKAKSGDGPEITVIFDEAQRLNREAIESLRDWNDRHRPTMLLPLGLIFIGNPEFALSEGTDSVLTGAVRSRLTHFEQLEYGNVSNADLALVIEAKDISDKGAVAAIIDFFSQSRVKRDLRQVNSVIRKCQLYADGAPVTAEIVRTVLNP